MPQEPIEGSSFVRNVVGDPSSSTAPRTTIPPESLLGEDAAGLSPTNIARLTACREKEYAAFRHPI